MRGQSKQQYLSISEPHLQDRTHIPKPGDIQMPSLRTHKSLQISHRGLNEMI